MKKRLRIIIIRHGQTKGNLEKRYIGKRSQETLTTEAAEILKENERNYPNAILLFTSPALRCQNTAKLIYPRLYHKRIVVDELNEMDFGIFEGKNFEEMKNDAEYRSWVDGGCTGQIPGGESRDAFIGRTLAGFSKVVEKLEKQKVYGYKVTEVEKFTPEIRGNEMFDAAIVAHGGTIMAVLSALAGGDYFSYEVKPGEGYEFTVEIS